jgi:hypothetical protein
MIASQLIYTSYKNGDRPQKGYMVYSKSQDITAEEESQILFTMRYNAPMDLPLTPTDEEIRKLFPKNYAYFRLSSGRYCIAQAAYVGQDYSTRWGNYIIHALVTDDPADTVPADFIGAAFFRTAKLTDAENEAPAPADLPRVKLPEKGKPLSEEEIQGFFADPVRKARLGQLLQNLIDAFPGEKQIRLYDSLENSRYWIGALSLLLPKALLKDFYFSTYVQDSVSTDLLKLSCMLPSPSGQMAYLGNTVPIYADRDGEYGEVRPYAKTVCEKLFLGRALAVRYVEETEALMKRYDTTDLDRTVKLVALQNGEYDTVTSCEELKALTADLLGDREIDAESVAEAAWGALSQKEFLASDAAFETMRLIAPSLSEDAKGAMLRAYSDLIFEACGDSAPASLTARFKELCPMPWEDAVKRMTRDTFMEHLSKNTSDGAAFLAAVSWIDVYPLCREESRETVLNCVKTYYLRFVKDMKLDLAGDLLTRAAPLSDKAFSCIYRSVTATDMAFFASDTAYLFRYLSLALHSGGSFWQVLRTVLATYPDRRESAIEAYVALMKENPTAKADFARYGEKYPDICKFLEGTAVYEYEHAPVNGQSDLLSGYEKAVKITYTDPAMQEKAERVFLAKLRDYLGAFHTKKRIGEGIALYDSLAPKEEPSAYERKLMSLIFSSVFGESTLKELSASVERMATVDRMLKQAVALGFDRDAITRAELFTEGRQFERASRERSRQVLKAVWTASASGEYRSLSRELGGAFREEFAEEFLDAVLCTVHAFLDDGAKDFASFMRIYLIPFTGTGDLFEKRLTKLLKRDFIETNRYIVYYFEYAFSEKNVLAEMMKDRVLESYLSSLNKNQREETFELLMSRIKATDEMKAYIEAYRKTHKSILDRITGFFSGNKKNQKNGDDIRHEKQD